MTKVVERDCGLIPMMNGHGKEAGLVPLSKEESQKEDEMTKRLHVLQEESLEPLKEDLSEWLAKTLNIDISAETFMDVLDNGVCLCKLAQVIQQKAQECVANGTCTESMQIMFITLYRTHFYNPTKLSSKCPHCETFKVVKVVKTTLVSKLTLVFYFICAAFSLYCIASLWNS
ncbi:hypothetical protein AM593_06498, partial [Mytilus galloprovincialis]